MSRRVLVVDDSPTLRRVVCALLEESGYECVEAGDGELALARVRLGEPFDVVLLDLVMPKMGGAAFCAALAELSPPRPVPVVLMSAHPSVRSGEALEALGVADALAKPFDADALLAVVEHVLNPQPKPAPGVLDAAEPALPAAAAADPLAELLATPLPSASAAQASEPAVAAPRASEPVPSEPAFAEQQAEPEPEALPSLDGEALLRMAHEARERLGDVPPDRVSEAAQVAAVTALEDDSAPELPDAPDALGDEVAPSDVLVAPSALPELDEAERASDAQLAAEMLEMARAAREFAGELPRERVSEAQQVAHAERMEDGPPQGLLGDASQVSTASVEAAAIHASSLDAAAQAADSQPAVHDDDALEPAAESSRPTSPVTEEEPPPSAQETRAAPEVASREAELAETRLSAQSAEAEPSPDGALDSLDPAPREATQVAALEAPPAPSLPQVAERAPGAAPGGSSTSILDELFAVSVPVIHTLPPDLPAAPGTALETLWAAGQGAPALQGPQPLTAASLMLTPRAPAVHAPLAPTHAATPEALEAQRAPTSRPPPHVAADVSSLFEGEEEPFSDRGSDATQRFDSEALLAGRLAETLRGAFGLDERALFRGLLDYLTPGTSRELFAIFTELHTPSSLSGTLTSFSAGAVLQFLTTERATGILTFQRADTRIDVAMVAGAVDLAHALGGSLEFRVGRYFVAAGLLSQDELEDFLQHDAPVSRARRRPLGERLLEAQRISGASLRSVLALQSAEIVYEVLRWNQGRFEFRQAEREPLAERARLALHTPTLIMEGLRRAERWRDIESKLGHFDDVLAAVPGLAGVANVHLSSAEARVLALADGERTVREIIAASQLSSFDACRILVQFKGSGMVVAKECA